MKPLFGRISWASALTFLLFFVLATLMWYGHAMQSVRNTQVPVYINYTGKPGSIGLGEEGLPNVVMIEVRDAGSRLNTYHRDSLKLTIDLRTYIHGDKGTIHVPQDALRRGITNILQGTSRLIETHPEEIRCPYFTEQEKSVVIAFDGDVQPANGYQLVGAPRLARTQMKIYGQDKALKAIDTIYTEPLTLKDISDTIQTTLALVAPKNVRLEYDTTTVQLIAEQFTEKKFKLPIHVTGVPEGARIRLFPNEAEVSVRMGTNHFSQVQASDIRLTCNYTTDRSDKLDVFVRYSNPFITSAWVYPSVVEFIIEQ